jgi:hypothetical protein
MTLAGFPHSEICGSLAICASPQLIAAYHVLHRLLTPRHPPCALSSLTEHLGARWLSLLLPVVRIQLSKTAARFGESCRRRELQIYRTEVWPPDSADLLRIPPGGDSRDRTGNLRLAKPALSQLSYIP